jgi:hypothetical protein
MKLAFVLLAVHDRVEALFKFALLLGEDFVRE